ncbi:hypothetical protein CITRIK5_110020 [Citricoccus sp. K5]|nr:hypothetical protein CITRIK5_110020 [Citricoccus sp. K5]
MQSNSSTPVLFRFGKVDVSVDEVARLIPLGPCPSCSMTTTDTSASAPMRGTLSCIADSVTNPEHTTLGQLQEMHADDWEIACHANSIAGGSNFTTVPADQLRRELDGVQQWAARNGFQTEHIAYPRVATTGTRCRSSPSTSQLGAPPPGT